MQGKYNKSGQRNTVKLVIVNAMTLFITRNYKLVLFTIQVTIGITRLISNQDAAVSR